MKLTLPFPPRKSHRRVCCVLLGMIVGIICLPILGQLVSWTFALWSLPLGAGAGLVLSLREGLSLLVYRAVNKLIRMFANAARLWVLGIVFILLFVAGFLSKSHDTEGEETEWHPVKDRSALREASESRRGGFSSILLWIRESGNWWLISLIPYFGMISVLETDEQRQAPPENIYTLY